MPMTPKQMIRLLEQNGFVLVSANGSHYKYHNPTTNKTTVVPFHAKDLKPGTEKNILKLAGLKKEEYDDCRLHILKLQSTA